MGWPAAGRGMNSTPHSANLAQESPDEAGSASTVFSPLVLHCAFPG